jgi:polyhydroxyalkanoate synthesis regulator phasin
MAKKDKKKAKKDNNKPAEAVGAVRTAVERTFQATADSAQSTRTRAQDLVDEVAGAASRVREMIEDINVLEDLKRLRTEVETLTRRVAALEDKPAPAPAKKPAASRSRARTATSRKTAASSTARAAGTARSTAAKRSAAQTRPKPKPRSTAAKPRSTAAKKPASS